MEKDIQEIFLEYVSKENQGREKIDLYDKNRNYIRTIYRGDEIKQDEWKRCILCFVIDKNGNVLVEIRKNFEKDMCSGHIKHNEVPTQAVLRELYEELGIDIEEGLKAKRLGNIDINFQETNNKLQCLLDVFCLFRTRDTPIVIDNREIICIERIPFEEFLKMFINNEIFECVSGYRTIIQKLEEEWKENSEKSNTKVLER